MRPLNIGDLRQAAGVSCVVDDDEVVVGVERQVVRVERAFRLAWREQKLLGPGAGHRERRRAEHEAGKEKAAGGRGDESW